MLRKIIILISLFALTCSSGVSYPQSKQIPGTKLQPNEFTAVLIVVKAEIEALGTKVVCPICVRVKSFKSSSKALIDYLRYNGISANDKAACYPKGQYPRGLEIYIEEISHSSRQIILRVITGDNSVIPDKDMGDLLRYGSYTLEPNDKGELQITKYDVKHWR